MRVYVILHYVLFSSFSALIHTTLSRRPARGYVSTHFQGFVEDNILVQEQHKPSVFLRRQNKQSEPVVYAEAHIYPCIGPRRRDVLPACAGPTGPQQVKCTIQ